MVSDLELCNCVIFSVQTMAPSSVHVLSTHTPSQSTRVRKASGCGLLTLRRITEAGKLFYVTAGTTFPVNQPSDNQKIIGQHSTRGRIHKQDQALVEPKISSSLQLFILNLS